MARAYHPHRRPRQFVRPIISRTLAAADRGDLSEISVSGLRFVATDLRKSIKRLAGYDSADSVFAELGAKAARRLGAIEAELHNRKREG